MPEMSVHHNPPVVGRAALVTPIEGERLLQLAELTEEMADRGWPEASVVSLLPFRVYTQGVLLRGLNLPAVPLDDAGWANASKLKLGDRYLPYVQHVFTRWEPIILEQVHGFEGNFQGSTSRKAILPYALAQDVVKQNNSPRQKGGVVCYKGNHPPLLDPKTRDAEYALLEEAHAQQIAHFTMLFEEANAAFAANQNTKINLWRELTANRNATEYLYRLGVIQERPKWLVRMVHKNMAPPQTCLSCGTDSKPGAIRCTNGNCSYVFKPYEAFDQFVIGLDTPGAVLALRRLETGEIARLIHAGRFTLDQLNELGFAPPDSKEPKKDKNEKAKTAEPNSDGNAKPPASK